MKLGEKYICKQGFAGHGFSYAQDDVTTLSERNINHMESLINAGVMVLVEEVPAEKVQEVIDSGKPLGLTDDKKFVTEKKSPRRTSKKG